MIKEILDLLKDTKCKAEVVQLAKGKNKFPNSFKEVFTRQKTRNRMEKIVIDLEVNSDKGVKDVNKLNKSLNKTDENQKKIKKSTEDVSKATKEINQYFAKKCSSI